MSPRIRLKSFGSPLNLLSGLLILGAMLLWLVVPSLAQESDESSDSTSDDNNECLLQVALPMVAYTTDIIEFIDTHYTAEEPATELLDTALAKFEEYEANMNALLDEYALIEVGQSYIQESQEIADCRSAINLKIREIEQLIRNHHVSNAGRKTTYELVTQLKDINEGLRDMNYDFAQMYALFRAFEQKLTSVTE